METVTAPGITPYEAHVQRQMIDLCRKIGRLQAALASALITLDVYVLPVMEDWRRDAVVTMVADLKSALAASEEIT